MAAFFQFKKRNTYLKAITLQNRVEGPRTENPPEGSKNRGANESSDGKGGQKETDRGQIKPGGGGGGGGGETQAERKTKRKEEGIYEWGSTGGEERFNGARGSRSDITGTSAGGEPITRGRGEASAVEKKKRGE